MITLLPITVRITDDGHGNCVNVKGGPMASAMTTFYLSIADINERPTSVEFRCTEDMVALGPFDGCVSDTYELNLTNLRVISLGEFHATDPDTSDSLRYELQKSSWTSRNFYLDDGNKLRVKSLNFQGTESPIISIQYFVVDSGNMRYPVFPTNMVQKFTLRFPSCAARKSFSIDEPLTQSTFEIPEYAALKYKVASGIPFSEINHVGGDQLKFKISARWS